MPVETQNLEAEQAVLGSMIIDKDAIIDVAALIAAEHFYREANREIFQAVLTLYESRQPVDLVTVVDALRGRGVLETVGGVAYVTALANAVPTAANAEQYAEIVRECYIARRLKATCVETARKFGEVQDLAELLEDHQKSVFDLTQVRASREAASLKDIAAERLVDYEAKIPPGLRTGFGDLDAVLSGLHGGELVILAGRPMMGKSSLMRAITKSVARKGIPVLMVTLEMTRKEQADVLISGESKIPITAIRNRAFGSFEWQNLIHAYKVLGELPVFIDDSPALTADDIRARARRLKARMPALGLVAVDYLQILKPPKAENRNLEVTEMTRTLKLAARELDVPFLVLSQLSRDVDKRRSDEHRPVLSDLRESGAIEQDADVVMFVYRESIYKPDADRHKAEIIVAKHRSGPTGTVELRWWPEYATFTGLDSQRKEG